MLMLGKLKEFLVSQSKNYKVLLVRGVEAQFTQQLVMNFNLFFVKLGATAFQLSTIRAVGAMVNAPISLPVGWLSDVYSIKKIMILGMIVQIISVMFYALASMAAERPATPLPITNTSVLTIASIPLNTAVSRYKECIRATNSLS